MKISIISDQISQDYREAFPIIREHGMDYVELHNVNYKSIENISDEELEELKDALRENDLKVANLATTLFFMAPLEENYEISLFSDVFKTFDGSVEDHLEQVERACYIANELDCRTIRAFPFRYPDNVFVKDFVRVKHRIVEVMKEAAAIAARYDVHIVLENCPYSHMPKGQMTKEVIDAVGSDHLQLLYDIANSYRAEKHQVPSRYLEMSLFDELRLVRDNIGHVHLKDYHYDDNYDDKPFRHVAVMDGDIDTVEFLAYLYMTDYDGYVSLEPEVDYDDTLKSMDAVLGFVNEMMKRVAELEKTGADNHKLMNCSQSTAVSLIPLLDYDTDLAYRLMEGFGSGMGIRSTCGALSGMNLIISLSSCTGLYRMGESKRRTEADVRMMMEIFLRSYSSVNCRDIKIDRPHCDIIISKCCKLGFLYLLMKHRVNIHD